MSKKDECIQLKNINYQTMLLNKNSNIDSKKEGEDVDKYLEQEQANKGENILLFGEGEERRDHVWIQDVADLTCRVLCHQSTGVINIATGTVVSFREIAEQITQLVPGSSQIKGSVRSGPMPHNGYRAFDPASTDLAFSDFTYTNLPNGLRKI